MSSETNSYQEISDNLDKVDHMIENVLSRTRRKAKRDSLLIFPLPKKEVQYQSPNRLLEIAKEGNERVPGENSIKNIGYGFALVDLLIDAKVDDYIIYAIHQPRKNRRYICIEMDKCKEWDKIKEILDRLEVNYLYLEKYTSVDEEMKNMDPLFKAVDSPGLGFSSYFPNALNDMVNLVTKYLPRPVLSVSTNDILASMDRSDEESVRRALRVHEELHWLQPSLPTPFGIIEPFKRYPNTTLVQILALEISKNIIGLNYLNNISDESGEKLDSTRDLLIKRDLYKIFELGVSYPWHPEPFVPNRAILDSLGVKIRNTYSTEIIESTKMPELLKEDKK